MKMDHKASRVKGFTIVEMVVVIAIIGILLGVLAPSMMAYIRRSRIQAANANAKMVYNAAQTEVQKYINKDRVTSDGSGFGSVVSLAYSHGKDNTAAIGADNKPAAMPGSLTAANVEACNTVIANVNRTVSGARDICWAVTVENYIVKGAVAADFETSRYIGFYSANKTKATEMEDTAYGTADHYFDVLKDAVTGYGT